MAIVGIFAFYWYEWRPRQARMICNQEAVDVVGGSMSLNMNDYNNYYSRCLNREGLK